MLTDALYGSNKRPRMMLEARAQPYVLAVRSNERLMMVADGATTRDASGIADALPTFAWRRHAAEEGGRRSRGYTIGRGRRQG